MSERTISRTMLAAIASMLGMQWEHDADRLMAVHQNMRRTAAGKNNWIASGMRAHRKARAKGVRI